MPDAHVPNDDPDAPRAAVRLPSDLEILWGRRATGRRGPRPGLDVDTIVDVAVRVANAEGLEAVSMARVAQELGFTTMSLYRHVGSKDELLGLMWNTSARSLGDWRPDGATWRERLTSWALQQREVIEENIWIVRLPMSTPPMSPDSLAWVERGLEALVDVDAPGYVKLRVLGLISQHALIDARMAYDERRGREVAEETGVETDYGVLLAELADPATYPLLLGSVTEVPPNAPRDWHQEFLFDLDLILDGFEVLTERTRTTTR